MKFQNLSLTVLFVLALLCAPCFAYATSYGYAKGYVVDLNPMVDTTGSGSIYVTFNILSSEPYTYLGLTRDPSLSIPTPFLSFASCTAMPPDITTRVALDITNLLTDPKTKLNYDILMSAALTHKPVQAGLANCRNIGLSVVTTEAIGLLTKP